jgi:hypothetical protein
MGLGSATGGVVHCGDKSTGPHPGRSRAAGAGTARVRAAQVPASPVEKSTTDAANCVVSADRPLLPSERARTRVDEATLVRRSRLRRRGDCSCELDDQPTAEQRPSPRRIRRRFHRRPSSSHRSQQRGGGPNRSRLLRDPRRMGGSLPDRAACAESVGGGGANRRRTDVLTSRSGGTVGHGHPGRLASIRGRHRQRHRRLLGRIPAARTRRADACCGALAPPSPDHTGANRHRSCRRSALHAGRRRCGSSAVESSADGTAGDCRAAARCG